MRNISTKADGVGDVLPASDFNANLRSELQNVVTDADFTLDPEGGPDTDTNMLGKAIAIYANAGQYYSDSGSANSYVLSRVGNLQQLTAYKDGTIVVFKAGNANTGASTINVDSLGSKDLVDNAGSALVGGEIIANGYTIARYNSSTGDFEIVYSHSTADLPVPASGDELQNVQVNSDGDGYELSGPLIQFKNKILNGDFDLWNYPSTTQTSSGYGSDDRWLNGHNGSTKTHSQQTFTVGQTDVPDNPTYYSRTVFTTASGVGDYVRKRHKIEFVKTFSGETVTLSFYAKAGASLNIATEFVQYFGTGGSPSTGVTAIGVTTHSLTTSWQKFTVTVSIPSISGKTFGTNGDDCLEFIIWFEAGSGYNSRTNSLGNQSGTVDISHIQIEHGPVATSFEQPQIAVLKAMCMRYYYRAKASASVRCNLAAGRIQSATVASYSFVYPIEMRAIPSITFDAATSYDLGDGGGNQTSTAMSVSEPTEQSVLIIGNAAAFTNVGGGSNLRIKTPHYIEFDAEL